MSQEKIQQLEKRIITIEARNKKVEADKAWETSWTRRFLILGLTYLIIVLFMYMSEIDRYWINAIVPSVGFWLSTLTVPFAKKWWLKKHQSRDM